MPTRKLTVRNNQSWELERVPVFEEELFIKRVLDESRAGARLANFFGFPDKNGNIQIFALLGQDEDSRLSLLSFKVSKNTSIFKSLTPNLPQAQGFEREVAEQYSMMPEGHPWLKPIRRLISENAGFFHAQGEEIHEVAVGPVHAGIIEPGHFRFQCHGERILNLEIQLGYQHRGIEQMLLEVSPDRKVLLAESIAGDTVIGHTIAYCSAMESLASLHISPRAEALRAVALELERLANHAGDLGALGNDIGFLSTAAYFGRLRGEFLNLLMELTGNRYGRSFCRPGGVLFDMDSKMIKEFKNRLSKAKGEMQEVSDLFFTKPSVLSRLENIGVVSSEMVKKLGFVGLTARAAGCERDVRMDYPHGMYRFHQIPISLANSGDVYSRAVIRWLESQRSIDFLLELLEQMPKGGLLTAMRPLKENHMTFSMVEGSRGEIIHGVITGVNSQIVRYKIKDPSFNNWLALTLAVRDAQISDFPLCNKSFNLSYAGHDL
ncbi:MAG: NADH-quinone oxidoreductase subunit C [Chlamydiae bacterium]|nr:NADH-quinone oxidoreductase subunit C [Chlamydiota bacterium]MBI3276321.1 NADH-quinone oxidoreductase subunit C [Chlamydiota bacterium]